MTKSDSELGEARRTLRRRSARRDTNPRDPPTLDAARLRKMRPIARRDLPEDIVPLKGCPVEARHLIAGMNVLAGIIGRPGGELYVPLYEKLEADLAEVQHRDAVVDRAKRFLEAHPSDHA